MSTLTWMPELKGRSLMRMTSFTDEEMLNLIDLAAQLKARRAAGVRGDLLHRRNIALIFEKSSTRTRNSFFTYNGRKVSDIAEETQWKDYE